MKARAFQSLLLDSDRQRFQEFLEAAQRELPALPLSLRVSFRGAAGRAAMSGWGWGGGVFAPVFVFFLGFLGGFRVEVLDLKWVF